MQKQNIQRMPLFLYGVSSWCKGQSGGMLHRSKRVRTPVELLRSFGTNTIRKDMSLPAMSKILPLLIF